MSILARLRNCNSIHDFAKLLGYKPSTLAYILYKIPESARYKTFTIPKKSGGERLIQAPNPRLKKVQRILADKLYLCIEEISKNAPLDNKKYHPWSHGFETGKSIRTNAYCHKSKRYVFNIDLQDFFPSINFGRVRGFFIKNNDFGLNEKVATIIAQIACYQNQLPQGSPCSPVISNLIANVLDVRLVQLAKKNKCVYSRYADDITFSTNLASFPLEISIQNKEQSCKWMPSLVLEEKIRKSGFSINYNKTRMQYLTFRQVVTGLVVNRKVNVKKEYYKSTRAMCHSVFKTGQYKILKGSSPSENLNQLEGRLSYLYNIKRFSDHRDDRQKKE